MPKKVLLNMKKQKFMQINVQGYSASKWQSQIYT
jgi:hypothetical protein